MAIQSPQAVSIPKVNPLQKGLTLPGQIITTAGAGSKDAYNVAENPPLQELFLQNCANQIVKVALNSEATANNFNFVLSAASGVDTGDGGERSIAISLGVGRVSLFADGAMRVAATLVLTPNGSNTGRV